MVPSYKVLNLGTADGGDQTVSLGWGEVIWCAV